MTVQKGGWDDFEESFTTDSYGNTAINGVSESSKKALYVVDTLDMTDSGALFIIPNTINYSRMIIKSESGTGNINVAYDVSEDQSGTYTPNVGFRPMVQTDNFVTATTDLSTTTAYQRGFIIASAIKVYVGVVGTGTATVTIILTDE